MSQQEDDLRALAKIMDFLRAVSIILVVMNVYWFCYEAIRLWGVNIGVVDKILLNFDRTAGLFHSILYTKLFAVLLLALSCLGTKGVKGEKITWGRIWTALAAGFVLFFLNWWILALPLPVEAVTGLYILTIGTGYVCLLMGGLWMSRLLKHNLMEDVFNNENESFMQETRLIESEYSVNLPTRFYYKKRWNNGWINVVNPFRASIVLGTSGTSRQWSAMSFIASLPLVMMATTVPPRAFTCLTLLIILSYSESVGAMTTVGISLSTSAIGPCFISAAG